ncbi:hypothetical protein BSKO_06786 [Bryopsis sp. KO-2023]|nr:hypothetical protein BSKO_06786 [Bryopsis sp. KO-2023]
MTTSSTDILTDSTSPWKCNSPKQSGETEGQDLLIQTAQAIANAAAVTLQRAQSDASDLTNSAINSPFSGTEKSTRRAWGDMTDPSEVKHGKGTSTRHKKTWMLDEFKQAKGVGYTLEGILGHLASFCVDQAGSRFIQRQIPAASGSVIQKVFDEVAELIGPFMVDVFANYIVQLLLKHGSPEQRLHIAMKMKGHVVSLSTHTYGCRVVQAAAEFLELSVSELLIGELKHDALRCAQDINGNHVIQKCIQHMDHEKIPFIIDALMDSALPMCTHPYGCRVLQKAIESPQESKLQARVVTLALENFAEFSTDAYGNYVIQHVVRHAKTAEIRQKALGMVADRVLEMSKNKFASNVVEVCITDGTPLERKLLIDAVLTPAKKTSGHPQTDILEDQYGNYVVQRMMEYAEKDDLERIRSSMASATSENEFGKHVALRLNELTSVPAVGS